MRSVNNAEHIEPDVRRECLIWLPHSYSGRGPAESCVRIIEHFADQGIDPVLFVCRAKSSVPQSIKMIEGAGGLLRKIPFRLIQEFSKRRLAKKFRAAIDASEPGTIAYFWPDVPRELVAYAKRKNLICVREFINSPLAHAKPLLDAAYREAAIEAGHGITERDVLSENAELAEHDFCFSSNAQVDAALLQAGVARSQVLSTTFGWVKSRFAEKHERKASEHDAVFRALFVGLINVRKGVPSLLEAWQSSGVSGELLLAGAIEPAIEQLVHEHCAKGNVRHLGHVADVAELYASCDIFVFPTHEEGGPQVTYEAAVCGIPILTTPMGAARLVKHDVTGMICEAGDTVGLADSIRNLAADPELRLRLAKAAKAKVGQFEYEHVGRDRATMLHQAAVKLNPTV